jgi:alpha-D-xyloside xylohydrolase
MPVFVRAGSIVPTGPAIQNTRQGHGAPLTLHVYTGANGIFSLYEDDGVSRQYLDGGFSRIPIAYDDSSGILTIGAREGRYPGMAATRTIRIRWMRPSAARVLAFDAGDTTLTYDGSPKTVKLPR